MDEKIKEILENPEVPDCLCPENIPALIKENGRKRKIQIIKPLRTVTAAAACLMIITVGLKVFKDNSAKDCMQTAAPSGSAAQSKNNIMCDNAAAEDERIENNEAVVVSELFNPQEFEIFADFLTEGSVNNLNTEIEKGIANGASADSDSNTEKKDGISVDCKEDGNILIKNEKTENSFALSDLYNGFSENDITLNDYVVSENYIYLIADLTQDSRKYTVVQKLDIDSLTLPEDDILYIQSGRYKKAIVSLSNNLILFSDQHITVSNTENIVPLYGNSMDTLVMAENKSVYYSSSLDQNSYQSLDITSISAIDADSFQTVSDFKAYVCPSPVWNFEDDEGTALIESALIPDIVSYNYETGDFKIF